MGLTPSLSVSPQLTAEGTVWYLRGTEIGDNPTDPQYEDFIDRMMTGAVVAPTSPKEKVDYPASFFPVSSGYINDPTFDASVGEGLANLNDENVTDGDVIFGFSQGAVVASEYKRQHPDKPTSPTSWLRILTVPMVESSSGLRVCRSRFSVSPPTARRPTPVPLAPRPSTFPASTTAGRTSPPTR